MKHDNDIKDSAQIRGEKRRGIRSCWCDQDDGALVTANYLIGRFKYRTHDHKTVLFSQKGSVWQKVLPYCIINAMLTGIVVFCKREDIYDLTFSDQGHSYMSILVSFLVVTRSSIAYKRYGEIGTLLTVMMKSARELVQHTVAFTRTDMRPDAKKYRFEIARQIIVMLRTVISVLREEPERDRLYLRGTLKESERQAIAISVGEANERTPNVLVIFLRSLIASHIKNLKTPLDVNQELALLTNVSNFIRAFHQIMKLVNSPFPFPLVQMTRTLLFIWLYSLPFALVDKMVTLLAPVIAMFFMTFGFLGLEFLSIVMDDPFGKDPIDFDVVNMGQIVFDDIYINIHDVDGERSKERLQKITGSALSQEIKKEVRGHARSFSRLHTWTSLEITERTEENERGCYSEDIIGRVESFDNKKSTDTSIGSSYFEKDKQNKEKSTASIGSAESAESVESVDNQNISDKNIGSRYFETDRQHRKPPNTFEGY